MTKPNVTLPLFSSPYQPRSILDGNVIVPAHPSCRSNSFLYRAKNSSEFHSHRWQHVADRASPLLSTTQNWDQLPGLIEWIHRPEKPIKTIHYIIWKNPWMIATPSTFIGSITEKVGLPLAAATTESRYPEINFDKFDPDSTLLLFSSEPFPFHKKVSDIKSLPFPSAVVDGQCFSWFGTHALRFLEQYFLF